MDSILSLIKQQTVMDCNDNLSTRGVSHCTSLRQNNKSSFFPGWLIKKTSHLGHLAFSFSALLADLQLSLDIVEKAQSFIQKTIVDARKNTVYVSLKQEAVLMQVLLKVHTDSHPFVAEKMIDKQSDVIALLHSSQTRICSDNAQGIQLLFALKKLCSRFQQDFKLVAFSVPEDGQERGIVHATCSLDGLLLFQKDPDPSVFEPGIWTTLDVDLSSLISEMKLSSYVDRSYDLDDPANKEVAVCLSKFIADKGYTWCEKNIKSARIIDDCGGVTVLTRNAAAIYSVLCNVSATWMPDSTQMFLFTDANGLSQIQSSVLLLDILSQSRGLKFVHHYSIYKLGQRSHANADVGAPAPLALRIQTIHQSYKLKYGEQVHGGEWKKVIETMALASLKLDYFSVSILARRDVTVPEIDDVSASRNSLYILYNYSRIHKVLETFDDKVGKGIYHPLPSVERINFSLLTSKSEWELCLHFILFYPVLLQEIYGHVFLAGHSKERTISFSRLYQFLLRLCQEFSSYYHQTKILLDPQTHLFPLMCARLYLVMAIKRVMDDCFDILNVQAPTQM